MDLRHSAGQYLALRRAMGYQLTRHDRLINQFIDYLDKCRASRITVEHALAWACRPAGADSRWHAAKLAAIRGFAAFVHADSAGQRAELIPTGLVPAAARRPVPYLYTPAQVTDLIEHAHRLRPTVRGLTVATIIALMAASGMRIGEALALDTTDLGTDSERLRVTGKYGATRRLPVHSSTITALSAYLRRSRRLVAAPADGALFVTLNATRPQAGNVQRAFREVASDCGLSAGPGNSVPRLHDLRHSFAVATLVDAHRAGVDVDARIAALATYLGHVSPASTYWYLTASPELLELAADRMWTHQEGRTS